MVDYWPSQAWSLSAITRTAKTGLPCSEAMNCDTSSVLHSVGLTGRQLWAEFSVVSKGGSWWQEAEEAGERDIRSSSSSPSSPLVSSSEWLGSEWHCGDTCTECAAWETTSYAHNITRILVILGRRGCGVHFMPIDGKDKVLWLI